MADSFRDPEAFSVLSEIFNGALFHWQARTPAVDADVDPPKRKRPPTGIPAKKFFFVPTKAPRDGRHP
ncbi:MAG: hypothetical protein IJG38_08045 [Thermoguttaceae bacterium]|nr:hypothetical protein [Thermoguttaceae bacterium]